MSVYPLGNMHPMGASYDDNGQSYDDNNPSNPEPKIPVACPSLPPINKPKAGILLDPPEPWNRFMSLRGAGRIFEAMDRAEELAKYDDVQSPVGVIMAEGSVAMTIRVSQIPEAIVKGWALLGIFDGSTGDKIVSEVSKAFTPEGSNGFPCLYHQFKTLAFPRLVKLHYMGQMVGLAYLKFLDKIGREISFYSGRNGFNKFFTHYFEKVKDGYRYPLTYKNEDGRLEFDPLG
jgi:hypothetical protein